MDMRSRTLLPALKVMVCAVIACLQGCGGSSEPPPEPPKQSLLSVTITPFGPGRVKSSPPGIDCPDDCTEFFDVGQVVTLTQFPGPGSSEGVLSSGSVCKSLRGPCSVLMPEYGIHVTASFAAPQWTIAVSKLGVGSGVIRSEPPGIDCGLSCSSLFSEGLFVTLSAEPATGSRFIGWGGACSGGASCVVIASEAKNVTATFE